MDKIKVILITFLLVNLWPFNGYSQQNTSEIQQLTDESNSLKHKIAVLQIKLEDTLDKIAKLKAGAMVIPADDENIIYFDKNGVRQSTQPEQLPPNNDVMPKIHLNNILQLKDEAGSLLTKLSKNLTKPETGFHRDIQNNYNRLVRVYDKLDKSIKEDITYADKQLIEEWATKLEGIIEHVNRLNLKIPKNSAK